MKIYIIQIKEGQIWRDIWATDKLKNGRQFVRIYRDKGYKARLVKEM